MKPALCIMEDVLSVKSLSELNPRTAYFHDVLELTKSVLELGKWGDSVLPSSSHASLQVRLLCFCFLVIAFIISL